MHYKNFFVILTISLWSLILMSCNGPSSCSTTTVETETGKICGKEETTNTGKIAEAFLGIPFAEPPVGENRWKAPAPKQSWEGIFSATQFGPICPQNAQTNTLPQSEDCLSINVWTPKERTDAKLPVMVFIYGGAFITGSSAIPLYDGSYLSANDNVVVVTFNYRVGALGFLMVKDQMTEGNFGFLDQQSALKWVNQNIDQFGGDSSNITIFGESAGAMSVGLHLVSAPESKGLFQAGIMESNPYTIPYKNSEHAEKIGNRLACLLGCKETLCLESVNASCMRNKSAQEILNKQKAILPYADFLLEGELEDILLWAPIIDGSIIEKQPMAGVDTVAQPIILGTNTNEGTLFVAPIWEKVPKWLATVTYKEVVKLFFHERAQDVLQKYPPQDTATKTGEQLAQLVTDYAFTCSNRWVATTATKEAKEKSVYAYLFNHVSSFNIWQDIPACKDEVCHGDELPYVFHTADKLCSSTGECTHFTPKEEKLSQEMGNYWTSFATDNVPHNGIAWPPFNSQQNEYLVFQTPPLKEDPFQEGKPLYGSNCDFWDTFWTTRHQIPYVPQHQLFWDNLLSEIDE